MNQRIPIVVFVFLWLAGCTATQEIKIVKQGARYNEKSGDFGYFSVVLKAHNGKKEIVCRGSGRASFPDLKQKGMHELDSIHRFAEKMIDYYVQRHVDDKDTVIGRYLYTWRNAELKRKNNASILEYKLLIRKQ